MTPPNLQDYFSAWSDIYDEAESHLKVNGNLAEQAAELPSHIGYYGEIYKEIYNIKKRTLGTVAHKKGSLFRFYNEYQDRSLSSRDIEQYINSDDDYYKLTEQLHDVMYWEGKFESLMEGFNSKNWMIGHITKLHIAEMDGVEI